MKTLFSRGAFTFLLAAIILSGCMSGSRSNESGAEDLTLKVMYYDERSFYQNYGMLFMALHSNIEVEVVSTMSIRAQSGDDYQKLLEDFLEEQKPDVLMIDIFRFEQYARDGKLLALDSFIEKDKYNTDGMLPGLIDNLRERGGGQLYGLTPEFNSQVVFYNKDLFDKYAITYPEDRMSWEDLLQLASRFPTDGPAEDRVYGIKMGYQANLWQLGNMIGATNGLSLLNPTAKQVTINTDSWKSAFATALQALKSGAMYYEEMMMSSSSSGTSVAVSSTYEDYLLRDPFISGRAAMTIDGIYLIERIKEAKMIVKERAIADWDVVTMPVNPENPEYSTNVSFYNMFAIDANSPNQAAAWKFIKYIHSDEFAKVKSKTGTGNLPVRTNYIQDEDGRKMEAFYALKPASTDMYKDYDKLPQEFSMQFMGLADRELSAAMDGNITISEALDNLQSKAQMLLMESSQKEN